MLAAEPASKAKQQNATLGGLWLTTLFFSAIAVVAFAGAALWIVPVIPVAVLGAVTGRYGIRAVCRRTPLSLWGERCMVALVVWYGILFVMSDSNFEILTAKRGSSLELAGIFLGAPWAFALTGTWTFAMGRLFEREARLSTRASTTRGRPVALRAVAGFIAFALVAGVRAAGGAGWTTLCAAACALLGVVCLGLALPRGLHSTWGAVVFVASQWVAAAALAPFLSVVAQPLVMADADVYEQEAAIPAFFVAWCAAFALMELRLFSKPYDGVFGPRVSNGATDA